MLTQIAQLFAVIDHRFNGSHRVSLYIMLHPTLTLAPCHSSCSPSSPVTPLSPPPPLPPPPPQRAGPQTLLPPASSITPTHHRLIPLLRRSPWLPLPPQPTLSVPPHPTPSWASDLQSSSREEPTPTIRLARGSPGRPNLSFGPLARGRASPHPAGWSHLRAAHGFKVMGLSTAAALSRRGSEEATRRPAPAAGLDRRWWHTPAMVTKIFVDNLRHGGIPKLAVTGDLDCITPMVLCRLQALLFAVQSKDMAKVYPVPRLPSFPRADSAWLCALLNLGLVRVACDERTQQIKIIVNRCLQLKTERLSSRKQLLWASSFASYFDP
jgi:hypothetical protein